MSADSDFAELMQRLHSGDNDVASEIFQRFGNRLIGLARSRMQERLRQKVDPEDVMQSVFKSFFRRQATEPFDLQNWDSLWSLLTVLTLRKCGFRARFYQAKRRDARLEQAPADADDDLRQPWEAIAREPSVSEVAALNETITEMMQELAPRDRETLELALQGYSPAEISQQLACSERTVQRLLARIKQRLQRLNEEKPLNTEI